ncbi:hypothetical protein E2E30_03040 [Sphingomonas sp. AAP5]|uniref:hypothetical protein n=1 Tax=Sphingomonas sp. AAP5 TaxID=1523415 RepID=UPI001056E3DD|nr:hypothetical protein [Sphingomonas sp. AAP5]QBM74844.1 hypothetical protein E2E30_03040 [Sphingomonas sp. AAP5]
MSVELDELQARLMSHFAALSDVRRAAGQPVFALEHGLDREGIAALSRMLKARFNVGGAILDRHWLLWVVWATEQGYDYDGGEYWHTFERRMPRWESSWRPHLRTWFTKFQSKYDGLKPTGRWAKFFSIIAWPITHALLPKDLQAQLAGTLYSMRFQLVTRLHLPPAEIGRFVSRRSYDASSRLRNFLEQEELAGRIILALLGDTSTATTSAIHADTLKRIVEDLEGARHARQWLRDTRREVEVATLKGAARPGAAGVVQAAGARSGEAERSPNVRPSLILRRTAIDAWTAIVEIPSFREVADVAPELGQFLRRTRCRVAGSTDWLPAGWLMMGAQRRVLAKWPSPNEPVVTFEKPDPVMDHLLSGEARIGAGPAWLFRIGPDGQAIEILSRLVRPGKSYVLVSNAELPVLSMANSATIGCAGVTATRLEIPAALTSAQIAELKSAGLAAAQTVRIWPAGLAARGWDGEGSTEWLDGEAPCFAIEHDHPVDRYELRLGTGQTTSIPAGAPGEATFVRLKPLPCGNHVLTVKAVRSPTSADLAQQPLEGVVAIAVRPPSPWVSGTVGHNGLIVACEPPEPSLDDFWEGLASLSVLGPKGAHVTVCVELLDGAGTQIASEQIGQLTLPLGVDTWRKAFAAFVGKEKNPWAYLEASSGRLVVDGEELGVSHIPLHRVVAPVRWVWHALPKSTLLKLVDDHDAETPLTVDFRNFAFPAKREELTSSAATGGMEPPTSGGLFVATYGDHREALIVSMPRVDGGLGGLLVNPNFDAVPDSADGLLMLLGAIASWSDVRTVGTLGAERRDHIVSRLKERVFAQLCGPRWAYAEERFRSGVQGAAATAPMVDYFNPTRQFGTVLVRDASKYARMPDHVRLREFSSLAHRYGLKGHAHCKAALEFCDIVEKGGRPLDLELKALVATVWNNPLPAAGARLLQLVGGHADAAASVSSMAGVA